MIAKSLYPLPMKENVIPGSDGAGEIVAVGPVAHSASGWKIGDRVAGNFTQLHISGECCIRCYGARIDLISTEQDRSDQATFSNRRSVEDATESSRNTGSSLLPVSSGFPTATRTSRDRPCPALLSVRSLLHSRLLHSRSLLIPCSSQLRTTLSTDLDRTFSRLDSTYSPKVLGEYRCGHFNSPSRPELTASSPPRLTPSESPSSLPPARD